jgi:hypothetical protein
MAPAYRVFHSFFRALGTAPGRRPTSPKQGFRPSLERLETREVLSGTPKAYLITYDWHGQGLVPMWVNGEQGQWRQYDCTDPGLRIAEGKWFMSGEGDPVAYEAGSTPGLDACFSMAGRVKTLQVKAKAADGTLLFKSPVVKVNQSSEWVTLNGQRDVGNAIDSRDVTLNWQERINGGAWRKAPGTSQTNQRLFVTAGQPLSTATAPRINYAASLAKGISHTDTLAIAHAIAGAAMSGESFFERPGNVLEGEAAWQVVAGGGYCADQANLMKNALGVLGIDAEVRYVMPRTSEWGEFDYHVPSYETRPGSNGVRLLYVNDILNRAGGCNKYEAVCVVKTGSEERYYMGGMGPEYKANAYEVWDYVTKNGEWQIWEDDYADWVNGAEFKSVPRPVGDPLPT